MVGSATEAAAETCVAPFSEPFPEPSLLERGAAHGGGSGNESGVAPSRGGVPAQKGTSSE